MTKQTFQIPEGCKAITMEQVGNQIITTFEPVFKRGDVVMSEMGSVCVVDEITRGYIYEIVGVLRSGRITFSSIYYFAGVNSLRHATPEEAQLLWNALAKEGKRWNPETMQVEEIKKERWRAKKGGKYYYISPSLRVGNGYDGQYGIDDIMHEKGNHFKTEEQAQRAADRLQAELDKFWEEELK